MVTSVQGDARASADFPGYPRGWFAVALSEEIGVGELHRMRYFGRELIAFRAREGEVAVLGAHCPHLGAHLGENGTVVDDQVRCPFHGWRFAADGSCAEVPYATSIPKRAQLPAYRTLERNGLVFVHYDPSGAEPSYTIPALPQHGDPTWTPWHHGKLRLRTHSREIMENVVDRAHFLPVHKNVILTFENEFRGHHAIQRASGQGTAEHATATYEIEAVYHGPGYQLSDMRSVAHTRMYNAHTVVDEEHVDLRFGVMIQPGTADPRSSDAYLRAYVATLMNGFRQDAAIWEHKKWIPRPILCDGDGPIMKLRQWYAQYF